jgi:Tetracyclin repressor-like, C-terminal domain
VQPVGTTEHRDALALPDPPDDALAPIRSYLPPGVPAPLIQRGLMTWTGLFGAVSFELYGQLHQVIGEPPADRDAFFAECVHGWLRFMNLG